MFLLSLEEYDVHWFAADCRLQSRPISSPKPSKVDFGLFTASKIVKVNWTTVTALWNLILVALAC